MADLRTNEDTRVDADKWLHGMDVYEELVAEGRLIGHRGNPDNKIRSSYWPDRRDGSGPTGQTEEIPVATVIS